MKINSNNNKLSKYDVVFCESIEVLKVALNMGLSTTAIIKTTSPALINATPHNMKVISLGDSLAPEKIISLVEKLPELIVQVRACLEGCIDDSLISILVARQARNLISSCYHALLLDENDFHGERAILCYGSDDEVLNKRLNLPWPNILASNSLAKVFDIMPESKDIKVVIEKSPSFIDRMKYKSCSEWIFKFWSLWWRYIPTRLSRGVILNSGNNPLLRETAAAMSSKGYALKNMLPQKSIEFNVDKNLQEKIFKRVLPVVHEFLADNIPKSAISNIEKIFEIDLLKALSEYYGSKKIWTDEFSKKEYFNIKAIMINTLIRPSDIGLYASAKKISVPVVSFQHGHGNEINKHQQLNEIMEEYFTSDIVVSFSEAYFKNRYIEEKKKVFPGVPSEYLRGAQYRKEKNGAEDILYVSTSVYGGHHLFPLGSTYSDIKKYRFERDLIKNVFSKIPHRVLYKKYLAQLFTENPSDLLEAEFSVNINFDNKYENLSFILPDHKVLVTSRATSTLGWCLASKKPLVFINFPDHYPLTPEIEEIFKEGIFLFNANSNSFYQDVHELLSRPINEIESEWENKSEAREIIMTDIIGVHDGCAGKRAAEKIDEILNEKHGEFK